MNFKIEVASSVLIYGSWNEDKGIWTGVIGELISNRADIGVAEFSMTTSRLDIVDFTFPLILSRNRIFFKKPDGSFIHWSAYFKVFVSLNEFILFFVAKWWIVIAIASLFVEDRNSLVFVNYRSNGFIFRYSQEAFGR